MKVIDRTATSTIHRLAKGFPVVALTGPRQSGKTTLARHLFKDKPYVSLENPDELEFARSDPKRFLGRFTSGAVLDEIQRCPTLMSWLQGIVDEHQIMGEFVITGSTQFELVASITQSLAGRVGRIELLPLSSQELLAFAALPENLERTLLKGGYPALYVRDVSTQDWFANYIMTYVERDVRQLIQIHDLARFQTFVRMCAARTGQILNMAALAADCGISSVTAKQWLTVLEASYIITLLRPHHRNFGKRLVKSPKLYFLDTGLAAWLIGIRDSETLQTHPARGALFETWVISELLKERHNAGQPPDLYFWRDSTGHEIDVVFETATGLIPIEIKSGTTYVGNWFKALKRWQEMAKQEDSTMHLVYGGEHSLEREDVKAWGWPDVHRILE